ncbi:MAG: SDR family NAD(P)-dependent oxidoreductase [Holophaga sp.]|nr:SDR family NAD(P)-dependent oxidoreductase [Holophaga sp.]
MSLIAQNPLAFIVGAGPGIGMATGRRFAQEGFQIAIVIRPNDDLAAIEAELLAAGALAVHAWAVDLADTKALEAILQQLQGQNLTPEVLIYNASGGADALPSRLTQEALAAGFQINVHAPMLCAQTVLPAMRKARRGTILFTGGGLALEPKASQTALSLGKTALRALTFCLAEELEPEGIHVATLTIAGWVQPGTAFNPEAMAEALWALHTEPREAWRREALVRA